MRLENNFTILSNTCIAGRIYHFLGMKFLSPTINLWISQPDFVKFCTNLKFYIQQKLIFFDKEGRDCPCAKLHDIEIIFNHYKTQQEAAEKWYTRCKRINYENVYIITSDGNGVTTESLNSLDSLNVKRVLIFTNKRNREIKNSFTLHSMYKYKSGAAHMIAVNKKKLPTLFCELNYKSWLLGKKRYRYLFSSLCYIIQSRIYKFYKKLKNTFKNNKS